MSRQWSDHELKGVKNGSIENPAIECFVMRAPARREWRSACEWPLANTRRIVPYISGARSDSVESMTMEG